MPLSCPVAPLSQRELHKDGGGSCGGEWRGEEGVRRPGPEGQFLYHVLRHALRNAFRNVMRRVLDVLVELELIQPHMAQKPVLRGEVGCACVAREVSVDRSSRVAQGQAWRGFRR